MRKTPRRATDGRRDPRHREPRRRLLAAVLLLALAVPPVLEARGRNIRFDRISIEQGLSMATVSCFLQDSIGFLWIGTQDGLNRYDGYDFVVYNNNPADPDSLANSWIMALLEDPSGDIWIATRGGGLSRWQRQSDTFVNYSHDPEDPSSLAANQLWTLHLDHRGYLWIGTDQSGLDRLDPASGGIRHFRHNPEDPSSLPDDQIRKLYEDGDGRLWVGTLGGLAHLDPATSDGERPSFTRFQHDPDSPGSLSDNSVRSILEDRAGTLWIGTFGGLNRFLGEAATDSGTFEHFRHRAGDPTSLSEDRTRVIYEDREGRLWIGTDGGLNLFDPGAGTFDRYRHDPADAGSLSNDRVSAIYQDSGGVLWIGTQGGGVNKWDPRTWSFASVSVRPSDLSGRDVLAFAEDDEGRLWIGTSGFGINRVDRDTGEVDQFRHHPEDPASLADDRVLAITRDRRDILWIGTMAGGLNRFEAETETFTRFRHRPEDPKSLGADTVASILEDRQGALWLGTFGGLNRLERESSTFLRFPHDPDDPSSLSDNRIIALAEDRNGSLWIGTMGGGLNLFDQRSGTFRRFRHDPADDASLSNDTVVSIHVGPTGAMWIGTQHGLNLLEHRGEATAAAAFRRYTQEDGLPNDFIYGIESDGGGGLWLSTNQGLSRFDPSTGAFKNYDTSHGLYSDEFNFGAHYRAASGELFFGGIDGFNAFYPDRIELNAQPPPVVLTAFSKLNRPVALDRPIFDLDAIELDHRDPIVSFEFAALDYTAPSRNRYRYQLEGFSREWIELGNRRRVSFTKLDPGRYTLRFRGSNNDGVWNQGGASVALTVAPPPWMTWWAYSLYVLALAAVIGGFVRSQQLKVERARAVSRRLREVDQLKGELLANLKSVVEERTAQVEERERLIAERERLIAELEGKNAELERFNYTVSHDLKSPLVTIKGFLGLLERDTEAGNRERARHDIRRIGDAADKMQRLLDELLELSRLSHQANEPKEVALDEVVAEALEMVHGLVEEKGAAVEVETGLPVVMGDRTRLLEVYQNLLTNAVKYMGDQQQPRVEVGVWRDGSPPGSGPPGSGPPVFYVRDNGMGIDPRYHEKVFGLFERLETGEKGTGIGLALVKRIVELHGGSIWVESRGKGGGSTFCFTLGSAAADAPGSGLPAAGEQGPPAEIVEAGDRFRGRAG